jgi:predicted PhzF superfamily epimerase YddE/YHI9
MHDVWWVNAFVGPAAGGNSTCVVLEDFESSAVERAEIARSLRAPDTVFVTRTPSGGWAIRFFSPEEGEMAFCGQGVVAAHAVLRALGTASREQPLELSTGVGVVSTTGDPVDPDVSWFAVARGNVRVVGKPDPASSLPLDAGAEAVIVDSGRARLYRALPTAVDLAAIAIAPGDVLRACAELQVKGICFYARTNGPTVALRVFTVSLAGGEDAATGGAVLGLAALLPPGDWTIEQGHGRVLNRGLLRLRAPSGTAEIAVGGAAEIVARGTLAHPRYPA